MIERNRIAPSDILFDVYGQEPPLQCLARLETENYMVPYNNTRRDARLIATLSREAEKDDSDIDVMSDYGSSLINWLYDASVINPLPPHYLCKKCKKVIFTSDSDGWDLPVKECCGQPMIRDGHSIPVEALASRLSLEPGELVIRMPESFADKAEETIRAHFRHDFAVVPFVIDCERESERLFVLIPKGNPLPELDENGVWLTDFKGAYGSDYRIIVFQLDKMKEKIRDYRNKTGLCPSIDDLLSTQVLAVTQAKLIQDIMIEGGTPLKSEDPSFSSLLRTIGYLKGSQTEDNPIFKDKNARYTDCFYCREEVWDMVSKALKPEYKISSRFAEMITKYTRQGRFTRNRMEPETEQILLSIGIEEKWIEQMKQTCYLPRKADLILRLLDYMGLVWYELQDDAESVTSG